MSDQESRIPAARAAPAAVRQAWLPDCMLYRACLGLTLGLLLAAVAQAAHAGADPGPARQRELVHLVRQECGFCHGLRLTGGLGAPLTAEVMRERPADTLVAVIRYGIPGTAMPPWATHLSEAESQWIVERLQEGFPNDAR